MKNKIFYLCVLIILSVGFYFLGTHTGNKTPLKFSSTARLMENGSKVNILTGKMKGGLGIEFVFTDSQNNIINNLSVENPNIDGPSYRIVKGNKHDWLVVTTIGKNGTGYMEYVDSWYLVTDWYGGLQKVLSYSSKITETDIGTSKELTTNVINDNTDDRVLDVEFTTKTCTGKEVCSTSPKINHYIWNEDKQDESKRGFILSVQ